VRQREAGLEQAFRRAGIQPWTLSTEEDLARSLVRFAAMRRQLGRGAQSGSVQPGGTSRA
jgi:hypothetical protein